MRYTPLWKLVRWIKTTNTFLLVAVYTPSRRNISRLDEV